VLSWLGAVYSTVSPDTGKTVLKAFNSGFCGPDFKYTIAPGSEQAISASGGSDKCKWDGQGLYVAAAFKHPTIPDKLLRVSAPLAGGAGGATCVAIGEGW
jgi:hypothetical protein